MNRILIAEVPIHIRLLFATIVINFGIVLALFLQLIIDNLKSAAGPPRKADSTRLSSGPAVGMKRRSYEKSI